MLKAGRRAATGENAVVVNCRSADIIVGPIGIVIADALLGEITPAMATAVCQSHATRVLIPVNHCENYIVGVPDQPIGDLVAAAVQKVKACGALKEKKRGDISQKGSSIKQYLQKFPKWGKIWRDFGHAFSFASSSSRGMYPSPSYLIWMCCTRFPLDLSGASHRWPTPVHGEHKG